MCVCVEFVWCMGFEIERGVFEKVREVVAHHECSKTAP